MTPQAIINIAVRLSELGAERILYDDDKIIFVHNGKEFAATETSAFTGGYYCYEITGNYHRSTDESVQLTEELNYEGEE